MKVYHFAIVGIVAIGLVVSFFDYKDWRYQETHRLGKGWSVQNELIPAGKLSTYQDSTIRLRLKYPDGWDVEEDRIAKRVVKARFVNPFVLNLEGMHTKVEISTQEAVGNLPDIVKVEEGKVGTLLREWEYVNGEKMGFTIITWEKPGWTYQRALGVYGSRLVIINVECETGMWNSYAKTFEEIYKSVVSF
jgi:hypothetical protein